MDNIINADLIDLNLNSTGKTGVIEHLADMINQMGRLDNKEAYIQAVMEREMLSTTGIGFGVAIPHGKSDAVNTPAVAFGKCEAGVDWQSVDGKAVYMVFLIAVPKQADSNRHLKILAALSRKLMYDSFRQELLCIQDKHTVCGILENILLDSCK